MTAPGRTVTATLHKEPGKGGWTYVVMTNSAAYSGTRGLVRIGGRIGGLPFRGSSMALGDGTHKLAVRADIRTQIGKQAGDVATLRSTNRMTRATGHGRGHDAGTHAYPPRRGSPVDDLAVQGAPERIIGTATDRNPYHAYRDSYSAGRMWIVLPALLPGF